MPLSIYTVLIFSICTARLQADKSKPHYDVKQASSLFENFMRDHSKQYKDNVDKTRHYNAFIQTLLWINYLNAIQDSAIFDINDFSDKTVEEAMAMFEKSFST